MLRLYILRHGKSSYETNIDFERGLKNRGKSDAENLGRFLKDKKIIPDVWISSSAKRAFKTAKILKKYSEFEGEILGMDSLYLAAISEIIEIIKDQEDTDSLMIIGHNPGLTTLVNYFGVNLDNLPTCGLVCFEFNIESFSDINPDNAKFLFYHFPKTGFQS